MISPEIVVGSVLATLLVALAIFFLATQKRTLQQLRTDESLSREDRRYLYAQVYRRTFGSVLMLVLAGMLVCWFFVGSGFAEGEVVIAEGEEMPEHVKDQVRFFAIYWSFTLLVFLALVILAVFDWVATARFGHRHRRMLERDRKAALASDTARYRNPPPEWN